MQKISYEELVFKLSYGGEIEFVYHDVKCAISYKSETERYFTVYEPQLSVEFSDLSFLKRVTLSGKTIEEIWPDVSDYVLFA